MKIFFWKIGSKEKQIIIWGGGLPETIKSQNMRNEFLRRVCYFRKLVLTNSTHIILLFMCHQCFLLISSHKIQ
jgi:hypothetical protein